MIDLDPVEFRRRGHAFIDWVAGYRAGLRDRPVQPDVAPGAVRDQLGPLVRERPLPLRPCSTRSTGWSYPQRCTGSTPTSSATSRLTLRSPRCQATCSRVGWARRECSGQAAGTEVEQGVAYLTHTVVDGRYTIRVAIGGVSTDGATVNALWRQLRNVADTLRPRPLAIGAPGGRARHESSTDGTINGPC